MFRVHVCMFKVSACRLINNGLVKYSHCRIAVAGLRQRHPNRHLLQHFFHALSNNSTATARTQTSFTRITHSIIDLSKPCRETPQVFPHSSNSNVWSSLHSLQYRPLIPSKVISCVSHMSFDQPSAV